jgi:hypothetical protein
MEYMIDAIRDRLRESNLKQKAMAYNQDIEFLLSVIDERQEQNSLNTIEYTELERLRCMEQDVQGFANRYYQRPMA